MSGQAIFVSYRREDSQGESGRLDDHMRIRYGTKQVFRDVYDSPPGLSFPQYLERTVSSCRVVIVVIGTRWLESLQARLNQPDDWVRLEIRTALKSPGVTVIPVLLQNEAMPRPDELPNDIRSISTITAQHLSDNRWDDDMRRLTTVLDRLMWPHLSVQPGGRQPTGWTRKMQLAAAGYMLLVGLGDVIGATTSMFFSSGGPHKIITQFLAPLNLSGHTLNNLMFEFTVLMVILIIFIAAFFAFLAFGSYRGWRWIFWFDLVLCGLAANDGFMTLGSYTSNIQSPRDVIFGDLPMLLLGLTSLALFVWMMIGMIRFGPGAWSTRKPGR